jgi:hypothetical protein
MKTKKLKNLVKKARAALSWTVEDVNRTSGTVRVISDPGARTHTVLLPSGPSQAERETEILYLHELGHAALCERVHPIFATSYPVAGMTRERAAAAGPALNAASDWFVGFWFQTVCADVADGELRKDFLAVSELLGKERSPTPELFCAAALMIAQARKYLREPVDCGGLLGKAVDAFLSVPPEKPSDRSYELLVNRLLAVYSQLRGRLVNRDGVEAFEVCEEHQPAGDGAG